MSKENNKDIIIHVKYLHIKFELIVNITCRAIEIIDTVLNYLREVPDFDFNAYENQKMAENGHSSEIDWVLRRGIIQEIIPKATRLDHLEPPIQDGEQLYFGPYRLGLPG